MSDTKLRDFTGDPTTKGTHFEKPVDLSKKSGFGPTSKASAFGGVDNPELKKTKKTPHRKVFKDGAKNKVHMSKPLQYAPFKMKAAGHNNSPIEKNFGPAKMRGFGVGGIKGGVQGKSQAKTGVGSGLNMGVAVGDSPNKFFKKLRNKARKMLGIDKDGAAAKIVKDQAALAEQGAEGAVADVGQPTDGSVPMHGEEAHTGGAAPIGAEGAGGGAMMNKSMMAAARIRAGQTADLQPTSSGAMFGDNAMPLGV